MLQAQVNYWQLKENQRHNLVTETIQYSDVMSKWANVELGYATLGETHRHNVQTENLGWSTLEETHRHNVVSESQGWASVGIASYNADTNRFNAVESQRHNLVAENVSWYNAQSQRIQAYASSTQAAAAMMNANTNRMTGNAQIERWATQNINDTAQAAAAIRQADAAKMNANANQQNARTRLYEAQLEAAELIINNYSSYSKAINDASPDVPWTLVIQKPTK